MRSTIRGPVPLPRRSRMAELKEALVPDIGDFDDVPVIEVLVAAGDRVEKDQGLVTLESDKATMEVPSPFAGLVKEVRVAEDDKVAEGAVVAVIELDAEAAGGGSDEAAADQAGAEAGSGDKAADARDDAAPAPKSGERAQPAGQASADEQD